MNLERVKAAVTADHHSRSAYVGRVIQKETFTVPDGDGNPIHVERDVVITWETIEAVLAMVRERAQI